MARWTSFDLIFFDCDSTLSAIEGVDELARLKGKEWRVGLLTQKAMDGDLDLSEVYGKRLRAIRPTRGELAQIEQLYWDKMVEDAPQVVAALQYLGKQVFIISGGLATPVRGFGRRLGVAEEHIRAVELEFNELSGDWWKYYEPDHHNGQAYMAYDEGPLTVSSGKPEVVRALSEGIWGRKMMVGDGASDMSTKGTVELFVGFGGVVRRPRVEAEAEVFVYTSRLAPILPLATGLVGYEKLKGTPYQSVFEAGLELCRQADAVGFQPDSLRETFLASFTGSEA